MVEGMVKFLDKIVFILAQGEAIPRLWVLYFGFGAITFGALSYPSQDIATTLIPMFLMSGFINLYGCIISPKRDPTFETARRIVAPGMSLMILASWTRAVLIWGVGQHGVGNQILASAVWLWITIGCTFLLIAVWQRGLR